jgi:hypothetical protein
MAVHGGILSFLSPFVELMKYESVDDQELGGTKISISWRMRSVDSDFYRETARYFELSYEALVGSNHRLKGLVVSWKFGSSPPPAISISSFFSMPVDRCIILDQAKYGMIDYGPVTYSASPQMRMNPHFARLNVRWYLSLPGIMSYFDFYSIVMCLVTV